MVAYVRALIAARRSQAAYVAARARYEHDSQRFVEAAVALDRQVTRRCWRLDDRGRLVSLL